MKTIPAFVSSILTFILFSISSYGQDVIVRRDGSTLLVKVENVNQDQKVITYKKWSNLDGPSYTISFQDMLRGDQLCFFASRACGEGQGRFWGRFDYMAETFPAEMVTHVAGAPYPWGRSPL